MKPFFYLNLISLAWVFFLIKYLPNSDFLREYATNTWLYIVVDAITIVPILVLLGITAWISKHIKGDQVSSDQQKER